MSLTERRTPVRPDSKPWPASCNPMHAAPRSGWSARSGAQHRAGDCWHRGVSASGMPEVVRYERQDPVIAFGQSGARAGHRCFVHVATYSWIGYPRPRGNAAESGTARTATGTRGSGPAAERTATARADGVCRWFGGVLQRTDVRGPRADDRVIRSNRAADPVSSIIDREGRRRS